MRKEKLATVSEDTVMLNTGVQQQQSLVMSDIHFIIQHI